MDAEAQLKVLRAENERLRARVRDLEAAFGARFEPPVVLQLPRREAQILGVLFRRERASKEALMTALYFDDEAIEPNVVESHVSKLRKRLRPFGIEITSRRFEGYRISADSKQRLAALVEGRAAA